MILEALVWATQRKAAGAAASGVAAEQAAIVARYLRCRRAWRPHLRRCRDFVFAGAHHARRRGRALVLGSGALLDIPLAALAREFAEVVLVDAAHPLHARLQAWRLGNVVVRPLSLVAADAHPPAYRSWRTELPPADYVVASMLLSQLPPPRAADPGTAWRHALIAAALDDLVRGGEALCVITETARIVRPRGGRARSEDPLAGVVPPPALGAWDWDLAPPGEGVDGAQVVLRVAACLRPAEAASWLVDTAPPARP
jgi:hypothetical protein